MKKLFSVLLAVFSACLCASAQIATTNSPYPAAISGTVALGATNTGAWVSIGTVAYRSPAYTFSHGPLANTTDVTNIVQIAFGNTNTFFSFTNVSPSVTNAGAADVLYITAPNIQIFARVLCAATNSVTAGAQITTGIPNVP